MEEKERKEIFIKFRATKLEKDNYMKQSKNRNISLSKFIRNSCNKEIDSNSITKTN